MSKLPDFGKVPPQAIEVEQAVLGALLIDSEVLDQVFPMLDYRAFYRESHAVVFRSMKKLYVAGGKIDLLTVVEQLRKDGQLEAVGGISFVAGLYAGVGSGVHAVEHAAIVLDKYILREAIRLSAAVTEKALDQEADPEDIIAALFTQVNDLQGILLSNQRGMTLTEAVNASIEDYFERKKLRSTGKTLGVPTPLRAINRYTNGWQDSDLIILAARPSMGKTAFAVSSVIAAARHGKKCVLFSIEMTSKKIADRVILGQTLVDDAQYRSGSLLYQDEQKIENVTGEIENLSIVIDDSPRLTMPDIWGKLRILKNKGQCDFVVIDYIGLIVPSRERGKNREQEVAEISASLKQMAKDLDVPVMVLSQLNRGVEMRPDKRPKLADLRESGSLEQDADVVILLYRDEYYNPDGPIKGIGEANIAKNRNGNTGYVEFKYNESMTNIYDVDNYPTQEEADE